MSGQHTPVERRPLVKPVKRPRGPLVLTYLVTLLHPALFGLAGSLKEQPMKAATRKHPFQNPPGAPTPAQPLPPREVESLFVDALARACSCREHSRYSPARTPYSNGAYTYHKSRRKHHPNSNTQIRSVHLIAPQSRSLSLRTPPTRDEFLNLLDYYGEPYSTQATWKDAERTPRQAGLMCSSQLVPPSSTSSDLTPTSFQASSDDRDILARDEVISVLENGETTHNEAFKAYSLLPSPGISYLSEDHRHLLFRRLSTMERKNKDAMLRYLSVVDDAKTLGLPLTEAEWNSAISFCGQCFARLTAADVEVALVTWKEMEQQAGIKSGNVTFNILFDMAAKAGKFVLAEMILKEMEARELKSNRYGRVGIIYYHGLKADGEGVRRAYREFVEGGEIVDTVVINCVIASLIRAGELPAAEQVYERMKRMFNKQTGQFVPKPDWKETRDRGRLLNSLASQYRRDPRKLQQIRDWQCVAPNMHTFSIFVEHHVNQTGEIRRISNLLSEMQILGVPIHGRIFLKLFKGFAYHGGIRYTSWTKDRLENVWNSLLDLLDQGLDDVRIRKWMVIWTIRAFERCCGRSRTLEIWAELRRRWEPGGGELEAVYQALKDILRVNCTKQT